VKESEAGNAMIQLTRSSLVVVALLLLVTVATAHPEWPWRSKTKKG